MSYGYEEIYHALEESVKLQSHYAQLLNFHDGGNRMVFANAIDWLTRLRHLDRMKEKEMKRVNQ